MNAPKPPSRLLLILAASLMPLCAQTPLFTDGPAFGGSSVFSEGLNPLGNSARFVRPVAGWYFTYLDGDTRAQDNKSILQTAAGSDPVAVSNALTRLNDAPWATHTKAYGIAGVKEGVNFGYTREELNSVLAQTDLDPTHLGSTAALAGNTTLLDGRRDTVDRISIGSATVQNGFAAGGTLRIERWSQGVRIGALNPGFSLYPLGAVETSLMGFTQTDIKTLTYSLDAGFTMEFAQGLRGGLTVDQINAKRLWQIDMKPQVRAGLQFDLGASVSLSAETDLNSAERMPFPEKQQASSASLRFSSSPAVTFILGAEKRKIGDNTVTRGGATLQFRTPSLLLGVGFQFGQDGPLKGGSIMVN